VRICLRSRILLLTDKQRTRLDTVFSDDAHLSVEVTWRIYQNIIDAYRDTDRPPAARLWHASSTPSGPGSRPVSTNWPTSDGPCTGAAMTSWPGSPTPAPRTAPLRPSTNASDTSAASPSAYATQPTTRSDRSSKQADSHGQPTLSCEEPRKRVALSMQATHAANPAEPPSVSMSEEAAKFKMTQAECKGLIEPVRTETDE
jgi:hypothetical protein